MFWWLASKKKEFCPASGAGIRRRFSGLPHGTGGEDSHGRHRGSSCFFFLASGGDVHDTSFAWELDLLHQGTCCIRRQLLGCSPVAGLTCGHIIIYHTRLIPGRDRR